MEIFSVWVFPVLVGLAVSIVSGVLAGMLVGRRVNSNRASTLMDWGNALLAAHTIAEGKAVEADQALLDFNKEFRESLAQFVSEPTLENNNRSIIMGLAGMAHVAESTFRWSQKNLFLASLASIYAHASAYDSEMVRQLYANSQDTTLAQAYAALIAELVIIADEESESPNPR